MLTGWLFKLFVSPDENYKVITQAAMAGSSYHLMPGRTKRRSWNYWHEAQTSEEWSWCGYLADAKEAGWVDSVNADKTAKWIQLLSQGVPVAAEGGNIPRVKLWSKQEGAHHLLFQLCSLPSGRSLGRDVVCQVPVLGSQSRG